MSAVAVWPLDSGAGTPLLLSFLFLPFSPDSAFLGFGGASSFRRPLASCPLISIVYTAYLAKNVHIGLEGSPSKTYEGSVVICREVQRMRSIVEGGSLRISSKFATRELDPRRHRCERRGRWIARTWEGRVILWGKQDSRTRISNIGQLIRRSINVFESPNGGLSATGSLPVRVIFNFDNWPRGINGQGTRIWERENIRSFGAILLKNGALRKERASRLQISGMLSLNLAAAAPWRRNSCVCAKCAANMDSDFALCVTNKSIDSGAFRARASVSEIQVVFAIEPEILAQSDESSSATWRQ
ncbi:hypothetical protein BC826DRAFT_971077 [Russula brevipes]|nr:hypothetical protein BC826DRAFT_971077 [Russula brevipes]